MSYIYSYLNTEIYILWITFYLHIIILVDNSNFNVNSDNVSEVSSMLEWQQWHIT